MTLLFLCIAFCGGIGLGCASGVELAVWTVALSSISLIACGYCLVCATLGCRCRFGLLLFGLIAGAISGGAVLGAKSQSEDWEVRSSSAASTFVQFRVRGASHPGWNCRVWLQDGVDRQAIAIKLNADDCPMWEGQRVVVRADELHAPGAPFDPHNQPQWNQGNEVRDPPFDGDRFRREPVLRSVWRSDDQGASYWKIVANLRQMTWNKSRGDRGLSLAFAAAMGMPQNIGIEDRQALRQSGMGHLIAVSGLHVALVGVMLQRIMLRVCIPFGQRVVWATILAWIPVLAYVMLTGASASAVRAAGMMIAVGIGGILGKPTHHQSILVLVASLMLFMQPEWILNPGFQFSICAMLALIRVGNCGIIRQSWHISWALAPLSWWHFGEASLWGVVANCFAIPVFSGWVLPWTLIGALLAWAGVQEPWGPARLGSEFLLDLATLVARLPILEPKDWLGALVILHLFLFAVRFWRHRCVPHRRWNKRIASDVLSNWWPPLFVWLGILVVLSSQFRGATPSPPAWFVWGTVQSHVIASRVLKDEESRAMCVQGNMVQIARWSEIARNFGFRTIAAAKFKKHASNQHALRWLEDRNWMDHRSVDCAFPNRVKLRAFLKQCRQLQKSQSGGLHRRSSKLLLRAKKYDGIPTCWSGGRWQSLSNSNLPRLP